MPLPLGTYTLSASAPGFAVYSTIITLEARSFRRIDIPLTIASRSEAVDASPEDSENGASLGSGLALNGDDLNALSLDNATFERELMALAGMNGKKGEITVNGFLVSHVPPRQTIQSVRINNNPYSAVNDKASFGRLDITTRPGGSDLHGQLQVSVNNSTLNAANPYASYQPANDLVDILGNVNGPLGSRSSFYLAGDETIENFNAIVNAYTLGAVPQPLSEAVPAPQRNLNWDTRLDRQFSSANSLTARYVFNQSSQQNGGLTGQVLPEAAFNSGMTSQTLQVFDSHTFTQHVVSESRLQYVRSRSVQTPLSNAPAAVVEGVSTGGGNLQQAQHDNRDSFEFQQVLLVDRNPHYLQLGARYQLLRDANLSTAAYNGEFIFSSLANFPNNPSQVLLTVGNPSATILTGNLGAFAQDDWRLTQNFSLSPGLRIESQSAIPDHLDIAPRLGFAWALKRKAKLLFNAHGGAGIFYDRFDADNLLTSVRQSGVVQQTYIQTANLLSYPDLPTSLTVQLSTPYTVSPNLRSELYYTAGLSADRTFAKKLRLGFTYLFQDGSHQWLSQNVNAPLPGSGKRPLGTPQDVYRFTSNGNQVVHTLDFTTRLRLGAKASLFSDLNVQSNHTDSLGATYFASDSYRVSQDFGRFNGPVLSFFMGGSITLPWSLSLDPFLAVLSGVPYNVTTGTDLNGDSIYNDRPAYATHPSAASVLDSTPYGVLDSNPQPGEATIPFDLGTGPAFMYLQLAAHRSFAVGPMRANPSKKQPTTAFGQLTFTVDAANLLNHNNPGTPVGVLDSPYFGRSINLNNPYSGNPSANRIITLRAVFDF